MMNIIECTDNQSFIIRITILIDNFSYAFKLLR